MASYFVYILECADKTLYIGSTNDLNPIRRSRVSFIVQAPKFFAES